jgi:hypothetical protein
MEDYQMEDWKIMNIASLPVILSSTLSQNLKSVSEYCLDLTFKVCFWEDL